MKLNLKEIIFPIKETLNKNTIGGGIGTLLEWLEFSLYGYFAYTISHLFFPKFNQATALLATFGVFAISYLARPVGAILFGYMGDRYGRKNTLISSILLMCVATFFIGITPIYETCGIFSPLLLMLFRFIQGIAVSGEFIGAAIFTFEHAEKKHAYVASSWTSTFSAIGMLFAAFFALLASASCVPSWGWRVPFIFSALACLYGFFLRKNLTETPVFESMKRNNQIAKAPIVDAIKYNSLSILKTMAIGSFVGVYVYICNIWLSTFLVEKEYFDSYHARLLVLIGQFCVVLLTPIIALYADKFGGKFIRGAGLLGSIVASNLLFSSFVNSSFLFASIAQILYAVINSFVTATMFKYLSTLFLPNSRYSGQSFGWALAVALVGGTAPLVAQFLVQWNNQWPAIYVSFIGLVAFLVTCV
ncbi:MAG: MFS transporter [bacterium]